jgi:hypothetical protein
VQEPFIISSKEIYVKIPSDYQFCPYDLDCDYYFFTNDKGHALYVDCFKNSFNVKSHDDLTEEKVKQITNLMFFAEGDSENLKSINVNFKNFSTTTVNGIKYYVLDGNFTHNDSSEDGTGFGICFASTEENIFFISLQTTSKNFNKKEELLLLLGNVKLNGTFLKGDKPTYELNFSSETFKDVVKKDLFISF